MSSGLKGLKSMKSYLAKHSFMVFNIHTSTFSRHNPLYISQYLLIILCIYFNDYHGNILGIFLHNQRFSHFHFQAMQNLIHGHKSGAMWYTGGPSLECDL